MATKKPVKRTTKTAASSAAEAKRAATSAKAQAARATAEAARARVSVARNHAGGFMNFIREQGVVGLAVGLAIGTAAGDTVKKLVEAFINPLVQLLIGSTKGLEAATWTLQLGDRVGDFKWGAFVSSLISLLATALVVYMIIHLMKLDKLDRKKDS